MLLLKYIRPILVLTLWTSEGLTQAILISRGGIPMSIGAFPESLSQAMLVGVMLVGGLGVLYTYNAILPGVCPPLAYLAVSPGCLVEPWCM